MVEAAARRAYVHREKPLQVKSKRALKLEALSDQLLRWGLAASWREIFLGRGADSVFFLQRTFTVVCSDAPAGGPHDPAIAVLAKRHGGFVQAGSQLHVSLAFEDPAGALRTAVNLQRLAERTRLRTAITSGVYTAAFVVIDGVRRMLLLDGAIATADRHALAAPPGSIQVCAQTYALLHPQIGSETSSAMVTTEFHGDEVSSATLTFPPAASSELSTFAGLGLT